MREICKTNYTTCSAFGLLGILFLGLITVLLLLFSGGGGNSNIMLSFSSLPSSTFSNSTSSSSSLSFPMSSKPNPNTALYPSFSNKKMHKAVDKLIKQLEAESMSRRGKDRDKKLDKIETSLASARALIKRAAASTLNHSRLSPFQDPDYVPHGYIYKNAYLFHRSYLLMESQFKIYVYQEGEPPLFHYGPCKNIYAMEGFFLNFMEVDTHFRTYDPDQAHVFFLPFSVVMILEHLFHPVIRDKAVLGRTIGDYVRTISHKYPYWNRSLGADHFMLSCHDWGPRATWYLHQLYFTSIRVLCNANTSEFFNPRKDASIPEINIRSGDINSLTGGYPPSNRTVLAFFAGHSHGRLRPTIFQHWKGKDEDIHVYEEVPQNISYQDMMKKSKYCLCPSGFEVASPRIVEAIYAECVPVLISQNYILPFSDVLNWEAFSIQISVSDVPNLKKILMNISEEEYIEKHKRVKQVQQHFLVNDPPKRYDVFNMILHSVWLRRLNLQILY